MMGGVRLKDIIQILITVIVVTTYSYLVIKGIADVGSFIVIATYVIKKFLDIIEDKN
jgi:hypothetical protein